MNVFEPPKLNDDEERAAAMADFFVLKGWTIGEAKRAFAVWYERVTQMPGTSDFILASDLQDFVKFVKRLRA